MDLLIRRCRLLDREGEWSVGIDGGRVVGVETAIEGDATNVLDAQGNLVTPTYVNGHVHLDKSNLGDVMRPNLTHSFKESLEITWDHKASYTVDDIVSRASRAIKEGIAHGTTVFRVFADVDTIGGLTPIEGILALRERWSELVQIQVVNFPQEAIVRDPGTKELMEEAARMGADLVGGLPWHEHLDEHVREHIDFCFDLAKRHDQDIHMLVDDTDNPNSRSLEYLAARTIQENYEGRVSASHCGALAAYDSVHAAKVIELVRLADINICSNPHISLVVGGRHDNEPVRRAITRVKELWRAGVNVFSGQDDVNDPYYPFGRNDQQEVASFMSHTAHMTYPDEIRAVFDFITANAARALGITDYGVQVGSPATLNVLAAPTIKDALRLQQPPRYVISGKTVLAENQRRLVLDPAIRDL